MGPFPAALAALAALAVATASTSAPLVHESTHSIPPADRSELFGLLQAMDISDTCVAYAVGTCAAVSPERQVAALLKVRAAPQLSAPCGH